MYQRARLAILSHVCAFSLQQEIAGRGYPTASGSRFDLEANPEVGDLVALVSAPIPTPFYLAWVEEVGADGLTHLLRSVENGEISEWSNVGFMVFDRKQVAANPHWRWSDEQHAVNDRWAEAFRKADLGGGYRKPSMRFEGEACTIGAVPRNGGEAFSRAFPSWRDLDAGTLAQVTREMRAGAMQGV